MFQWALWFSLSLFAEPFDRFTFDQLFVQHNQALQEFSLIVLDKMDLKDAVAYPAPIPAQMRELHEKVKRHEVNGPLTDSIQKLINQNAFDPITAIFDHVAESAVLKANAVDFVTRVYEHSGNFGKPLPQTIVDNINQVIDDARIIILITDPKNPWNVYQVVAFLFKEPGKPLPLSQPLVAKGLEDPFPDSKPQVIQNENSPFFMRTWLDAQLPGAQELFNSLPHYEGATLEIKMYAMNPEIKLPWRKFLHRYAIAKGISRLSQQEVSATRSLVVPPHEFRDDLERLTREAEARKDFKDAVGLIRVEREALFGRSYLDRIWAGKIVAEAVGDHARIAYKPLGLEPVHQYNDHAFPGKPVYLLQSTRQNYEKKAVWYSDGEVFHRVYVRDALFSSPFPQSQNCARVLHWKEAAIERAISDGVQKYGLQPFE